MNDTKHVLSLLEDQLKSSKHTTRNNYIFYCPKCQHRKPKLEIDISTGSWHCWVCSDGKGKSFKSLGNWLGWTWDIIKNFPNVKVYRTTKDRKIKHEAITLPKEYIPLSVESNSIYYKRAIKFLKSRGVRYSDILQHFIGYAIEGQYKNMIIFPNYDKNGKLNYFTTRAFIGSDYKKFENPNFSKNIIGFESCINWSIPIIIVEGALDAIAVRLNAIPCYGKITRYLRDVIILKKPKHLFLALDSDAITDSYESAKDFIAVGINVSVVKFPKEQDPSSLGFEDVWKSINNNSELIDKNVLLENFLKTKFKL